MSYPVVNSIYLKLRQQITSRLIPPGSKLSEGQLCKQWHVSRTPIREVLRRLEAEGLVTSYPYRGFVVDIITIEDVDQLYTIKICLEGLAGRLATAAISKDPGKLRFLEKLCREMETLCKKRDIPAYIAKNIEFHAYVWHSCGNKWLIKILENLTFQVNRFIVKALHVPQRMERSVKEHWEIYENLKMGKARAVEKAVQNNHKRALEDLRKELTSG